jgi:hypothetical protein
LGSSFAVGKYLVHAVTESLAGESFSGNSPDHTLLPESR